MSGQTDGQTRGGIFSTCGAMLLPSLKPVLAGEESKGDSLFLQHLA